MQTPDRLSLVIGFLFIQACAEGGIGGTGAVTDPVALDPPNQPTVVEVSGQANKGPYRAGSNIRVRMLETDAVASAVTSGMLGEFRLEMHEGEAGRIDITGRFFSEHLGTTSANEITLSAVTLGDAGMHANVNVATHLVHLRVIKLMEAGMAAAIAIETATTELRGAISAVIPAPAHAMRLGDLVVMNAALDEANEEGNAWLLALSSIIEQMALRRQEGDGLPMEEHLQEAVDEIAAAMAERGEIHSALVQEMLTARQRLDPDGIHAHLMAVDGDLRLRTMARHFGMSQELVAGLSCDVVGAEIRCGTGGHGMGGSMMQAMNLEGMVANMNRFIDTDGDGIVNQDDDDDDNDGIPDGEDDKPYGG